MNWHLIADREPHNYLWNMALDEMLMQQPIATPVLRIYQWDSPTISIGYFQKIQNHIEECEVDGQSWNLIRRITGGGLVRHGKDITLSLILPENNTYFSAKVTESYRDIHHILFKAFESIIPTLSFSSSNQGLKPRSRRICFEEPTAYDIESGDKKIIGSSQRRRDGVLLHQTSMQLPLEIRLATDLISKQFENTLNIHFVPKHLTLAENEKVQKLIKEKYRLPEYSLATVAA